MTSENIDRLTKWQRRRDPICSKCNCKANHDGYCYKCKRHSLFEEEQFVMAFGKKQRRIPQSLNFLRQAQDIDMFLTNNTAYGLGEKYKNDVSSAFTIKDFNKYLHFGSSSYANLIYLTGILNAACADYLKNSMIAFPNVLMVDDETLSWLLSNNFINTTQQTNNEADSFVGMFDSKYKVYVDLTLKENIIYLLYIDPNDFMKIDVVKIFKFKNLPC